MKEKSPEEIKRLIRTLKILDWSESDIQRVVNIKREDLRKILNQFHLD